MNTPAPETLLAETLLAHEAANFARYAHEGQMRRDGVTPYIDHVASVSWRVYSRNQYRGERSARLAEAVAWLHDVLEDSDITEAELRLHFPDNVVDAVVALTKHEDEAYEDYLQRVAQNELAVVVKVADMLSNLADAPSPKQILRYANALAFLVPLLPEERAKALQRPETKGGAS